MTINEAATDAAYNAARAAFDAAVEPIMEASGKALEIVNGFGLEPSVREAILNAQQDIVFAAFKHHEMVYAETIATAMRTPT